MKKVLVLLSTYNGEKYLDELLESLLNQKMVNLNILIRDDGSRDGTISVLKKYETKHKNVQCIYGKNLGPTNSFFSLISSASFDYDYYALCDQDDVWLENKLKVAVDQLSIFDKNEPSLYYSGQILTDQNLRVISNHTLDVHKSVQANFIFNQMAGCTSVFNLKLLKLLKEYSPKNVKCHDVWCYKLCASIKGNIVVDSKGYILYRQHGNNVIGVDNSLLGKFRRAKKYVFYYNVSHYAKEILNGYEMYLDDKWKQFLQDVCSSNFQRASRKRLLQNQEINFHSSILKILFVIKVFLRKI